MPEKKNVKDVGEKGKVKDRISEEAEVAKMERRLAAQESEINRENKGYNVSYSISSSLSI